MMAQQPFGMPMNASRLAAMMAFALLASAPVASAFAAPAVAAPLSEQMRAGFPGATPVAGYSATQIAQALQKLLSLGAPPALGEPVSVTPDTPYAADGTHLSFWKPAFVLGTAGNGEAGFNFWDLYQEGHAGIGTTRRADVPALLDCRLYSSGNIVYKIYSGDEGAFTGQGELKVSDGHALLLLPARPRTEPVAVELWPNPAHALLGFFGCTLWPFTPVAR